MQFHKLRFPVPAIVKRLFSYLRSIPGKHLVFVEYSADHPYPEEWVFNGTDNATEFVTFVRVCGPMSDRALIRALPDHDVCLARPNANSLVRIHPESAASNHF